MRLTTRRRRKAALGDRQAPPVVGPSRSAAGGARLLVVLALAAGLAAATAPAQARPGPPPPPWAPAEAGPGLASPSGLRLFQPQVGRSMPGFWRAFGTEAHRAAYPGFWQDTPGPGGTRWALLRAEGHGAAYLLDAQERVVGERLFEPIRLQSPRNAVNAWIAGGLKGKRTHLASPNGALVADALAYEGRFGDRLVRRVAIRVPSAPDRFPPVEELWLVEASDAPEAAYPSVNGLEVEARLSTLQLAARPPRVDAPSW